MDVRYQRARSLPRLLKMAAGIFAVAALALVSGCGKNEKFDKADVRVLHLATESGSLSVRIDDETDNWLSGIVYETTTGFKQITNGSRRLRISNAGGVIIDSSVTAVQESKQLLVIYGGASSLGMSLLNNDIANSGSGKTRVRLINYAVGLGTYDLYLTTASEDYRSVEPKARNTSSITYELDSGTYTIRLTAPNTKDILFEMPARALEGQKYYNLGLYNEGSGELPSAFWLQQSSDTAPELITNTLSRVRAANAQPGIATVNVSVSGTRVFTSVPFGGISNYARTGSGAKTITYADAANAAQTYTLNDSFEGGRDYSTFLAADAGGGAPSVFRVSDDLFPPTSGKARVRLVNASTVAELSLALSFAAVTPTVAVRNASSYVEVTAGDGTPVTITQGAAATPVASLSGTDLTAGRNYSIVVSGIAGQLQITSRQDN